MQMITSKRRRGMKFAYTVLAAAAMSGSAQVASAAAVSYTWLASPATHSWNLTDTNWSGGTGVWVNDPADSATFNVAPAAANNPITLDANITLNNISFTTGGWTINAGSGNLARGAAGNITLVTTTG